MPPPDLEARYDILRVHTRNMRLDSHVDLRQLAENTNLFTGAELEGLCREAGIVALREDISATVVCDRHFQTVRQSLNPALTAEEIESYSSFMKNPSLRSSGSLESRSNQSSKGSKNLHLLTSPVTIGIVSLVVFAAMKYLFTPAEILSRELRST